MVPSLLSFHLSCRGSRKFGGGAPSDVADRLVEEEKRAAFAMGENCLDSGETAVYGRARASAMTVLLVDIV